MSNLPVPPPFPASREKKDLEQLGLVAIFHFVMAGFYGLGIGFLWLHYTLMQSVFTNPQLMKGPNSLPPTFFAVFKWVYVVLGVICVILLALNAISGRFIQQRRNRIFSMIIAGIDCLQVPFGTALGVFTFVVLSRDSVQILYVRSQMA